MTRVLAIGLNTFREAIRNKVLYVLLFFAIALILSALAVAQISLQEDARIVRDLGLGGISVFGVVIAIFVGTNLVYKELDRKTVFTILPKPLYRHEFVLGKFVGICLTLLVQVVLMTLVLFGVMLIERLGIEGAVVRAIVLIYLEILLITALAVFFSTFSTPLLSALFTAGLFVVGRSVGEIQELMKRAEGPVLAILTVVTKVVPDLRLFYVSGAMLNNQPISVHQAFVGWGYVGQAAVYSLGYATVALVLASVFFARRDFT